jgi:molybdopterin molybdotransferase
MISVEEAQILIQKHMPSWGQTTVSLSEAALTPILETIRSDRDYPPFHRVMMDGIAVNFSEFEKGKLEFSIEGIAPAGEPIKTLKNLHGCIEVMTGAPLPIGCDLVIQYEHLKIENDLAKIVIEIPRKKFDFIHMAGSDCKKGDVVLSQGEILNGPHWGIAASLGIDKLKVNRLPKVMIISTGDELVEVTVTPKDHEIRRSNAYALKASLLSFGHHEVELAHLKDDPKEVADHYEKYADLFDLLIYSGGVSKGKFDYLPSVWCDMGVTKHFHEVSQRPGKPLWFGVDEKRKTTILGLPGNPVSSLVCLHRYFLQNRKIVARLGHEITFDKPLTYFLPVKLQFGDDGVLTAFPVSIKNSGEFSALAGSDGFIELPKDQNVFKANECFQFYPWRPSC